VRILASEDSLLPRDALLPPPMLRCSASQSYREQESPKNPGRFHHCSCCHQSPSQKKELCFSSKSSAAPSEELIFGTAPHRGIYDGDTKCPMPS